MAKAILFNNYTDEDFTHNFDGSPWTFKAGEQTRLQEGIAYIMAKHLVDREMMKDKVALSDGSRRGYLAKVLIEEDIIEEESPEKLEKAMLNEKFVCEVCGKEAKSKAGLAAHMRSHKKEEKEEEFEGLE